MSAAGPVFFQLAFTPTEGDAACCFHPGEAVAEEIRHRASADFSTKSHRTPQPQPFQASAIAELEERVTVRQDHSRGTHRHDVGGICATTADVFGITDKPGDTT